MYRRLFTGLIERGKTAEFLDAMRQAATHQTDRGIRARTAVWGRVTGHTNGVAIASDFNTLNELEKFTDLATEDASFAVVRRAVRTNMVFESSEVSIHRLAYHSEGLISSEEVTTPLRYMRILTGEVLAGHHRDFVMSISQAEFDSLTELESFDDMAAQDAEFAQLRRQTRESMVFLTSEVDLYRNLI